MSKRSAIASALGRSGMVVALAAGSLASLPVRADPNVYGGMGLGLFRAEVDVASFAASNVATNKDDSTAFRVFGGYNITRGLAVELGWNKLHGTKAIVSGGAEAGNHKLDNDGFDLSAVGTMSLGKYFSLFGRLGLYSWDAEDTNTTTRVSKSDSGTDILYGGGLRFDLTKNIGFRAEYDVYDVDAGAGEFGIWYVSGILSF